MTASIPLPRRSLTLCLAAFFSPAMFFFLLLLADHFFVSGPPEALVVSLFYLIPIAALLICGSIVWSSELAKAHKIRGILLTFIGMLIQFGGLLVLMILAAG